MKNDKTDPQLISKLIKELKTTENIANLFYHIIKDLPIEKQKEIASTLLLKATMAGYKTKER